MTGGGALPTTSRDRSQPATTRFPFQTWSIPIRKDQIITNLAAPFCGTCETIQLSSLGFLHPQHLRAHFSLTD